MNVEQQSAFDAVLKGHNIFLSGQAGTGKSYVIKNIKQWAITNKKQYFLTALTGCAATLIGGRTLHSALGLRPGNTPISTIVNKIKEYNKPLYSKLVSLELLIVDEVSMMSDDLFEKVSLLFQEIRQNDKPFGGVQLVLSGDFAQLGPVTGDFCFKSPLWSRTIEQVCELHVIIRQSNDELFRQILKFLRKGKCTPKILKKLEACSETEFPEHIVPTKLFSKRADADKVNEEEYTTLIHEGAEEMVYKANILSKNKKEVAIWAKQIGICEEVKMCVGAQVVITANLDQERGIINGTRGVVTSFSIQGPVLKLADGSTFTVPFRKIKDDSETLEIEVMPLQYAWAITIHRSQGMTLDAAEIDLGVSIFAPGQAYTAISRVRNLQSVRIVSVSPRSFIVDRDVKKFYGM